MIFKYRVQGLRLSDIRGVEQTPNDKNNECNYQYNPLLRVHFIHLSILKIKMHLADLIFQLKSIINYSIFQVHFCCYLTTDYEYRKYVLQSFSERSHPGSRRHLCWGAQWAR